MIVKSPLQDHSLSRYLPPLPENSLTAFQVEAGNFVLDPFGASPTFNVEIARQGPRLIVAANNPITRLLIEIAAHPPTPEDAHAVLSKLAASRIQGKRLEIQIQNLYRTNCPECVREIQATGFVWEKEATEPIFRLINCPHCKTVGEFPATESDKLAAAKFKAGGLHFARALERVAPIHDPDRIHVEEALSVYPPRSVYALQTIVNKIDTLPLDTRERQILEALLLHAFDQANTLWSYPSTRNRPRQLTIPPMYRENNIWLALEKATDIWQQTSPKTITTYWPELPPKSGGICIFDGRIKKLIENLADLDLAAVIAVFPRPNQAYWSLCALWAGWLWGGEAVEKFKSVLRRRRFDWSWYTTANQTALSSINQLLDKSTPVEGLIAEAEPGFVAAAIISALYSQFKLKQSELDTYDKIARFTWQPDENRDSLSDTTTSRSLSDRISELAIGFLQDLGEPCSYFRLSTAIFTELAEENDFPVLDTAADCYNKTQQTMQSALSFKQGLLRFGGSENSLEVGRWWLRDASGAALPLADQVEMWIVRYLIQNPNCTLAEIETSTRTAFPNLRTPSRKLIIECLNSYGEEFETGWRLKENDSPKKRKEDLNHMVNTLVRLGEKLGLNVTQPALDNQPYIWENPLRKQKYHFYISVSALLGKFFLEQNLAVDRNLIIIPGGRSNLIMFKLKRDPRFQKIFDNNWQFVKFRQIRQLSQSTNLTLEYFETQLGLDPLTYQETQLRMF